MTFANSYDPDQDRQNVLICIQTVWDSNENLKKFILGKKSQQTTTKSVKNDPVCKEFLRMHSCSAQKLFCSYFSYLPHTRAPPSTQPPCAFKKWRYICCQIISVELPWFNVGFGAQVLLQTPCDKILFSCQILSVISMFTMFILKFWQYIKWK